jgi:hypothetical protein
VESETSGRFNKFIVFASILNILGLFFVLLPLLRLTPITILLSTGLGGLLIGAAVLLYLYVVLQDLRRRKML